MPCLAMMYADVKDCLIVDESASTANPAEGVGMRRAMPNKVTVKWNLKDTPEEKDVSVSSYLMYNEAGAVVTKTSAELKACKDKTFSMSLTPGKWTMLMRFSTNTPLVYGMSKYVIKENVTIDRDTTFVFDGAEATRRIGFEPVMPDGKKAEMPTADGTKVDYTGANAYTVVLNKYFSNRKVSSWVFSEMSQMRQNSVKTGKDDMHKADILINEGVSDDFYTGCFYLITPLDSKTNKADNKAPMSLVAFEAGCAKTDTVYKNRKEWFVTFDPAPSEVCPGSDPAAATYKYDYKIVSLKSDGASTGMSGTMGGGHDKGRLYMCVRTGKYSNTMMSTMDNQTTEKVSGSTYQHGSGLISPQMMLGPEGVREYVMNDNIGSGGKVICNDETGKPVRSDKGHPYFSYKPEDQDVEFGGSSPILSLPIVPTDKVDTIAYVSPLFKSLSPQWLGNFGERRLIDMVRMRFTATAGKDTICRKWSDFSKAILEHSKKSHEAHEIKMIFENDNYEAGDVRGLTTAEIMYKEGNKEICAPTLQMLQIRTTDGKITNRLEKNEKGLLNVSYGDFNYHVSGKQKYYSVEPCEIKVETRPMRSGEWKEMKTQQMEEYFVKPLWGYFNRGTIDAETLGKNAKGWYDVRISLKDAAGNTQTQTISPAFYADFSNVGVGMTEAEGVEIGLNGGSIEAAGCLIEVYNAGGLKVAAGKDRVDLAGAPKGMYIVKASGEKGCKVKKIVW